MPAPLREAPTDAVDLIKSFEGIPDGDPSTVNLDAYLDPVGIWTIGWGHAVVHDGRHLKGAENKATARRLFPGGITQEQAEALLRADLLDRSPGVLSLVKPQLTDAQFGALLSFTFNAGAGRLATSTLLKLLNAGRTAAAADQFLLWNKARDRNGVLIELAGLTRRRRAERALFLGEDWRAAAQPTRSAPPATRSRGAPAAVTVAARTAAPEPLPRPVAPSAASQRAAAARSGVPAAKSRRGAAKTSSKKATRKTSTRAAKATKPNKAPKRAAATPRARTTRPKAPPKATRAKHPARRTAR